MLGLRHALLSAGRATSRELPMLSSSRAFQASVGLRLRAAAAAVKAGPETHRLQSSPRAYIRGFCSDERPTSSFNVQDYEDFRERVLESERPVVVDFHADWCGPCRMLGPRLESIVSSRNGEVVLAKVDIDENSEIAMDYDVRSVPTVLAVKDGEIVDKFVGLQEEEAIERFVDRLAD